MKTPPMWAFVDPPASMSGRMTLAEIRPTDRPKVNTLALLVEVALMPIGPVAIVRLPITPVFVALMPAGPM